MTQGAPGTFPHIETQLIILSRFPQSRSELRISKVFKAVGTGEMTIDVPNGVDISQLSLTEVLYSPEVGYTLVSVGRLDDKGFSLMFAGGKCTIKGPDGAWVGEVPKNSNGLYKVAHE
jgi:hypothetical protein